jgi:hypothetical protein
MQLGIQTHTVITAFLRMPQCGLGGEMTSLQRYAILLCHTIALSLEGV